MLPPVGTKIKSLEGVDLGASGAVVQRVGPGRLTLELVDQNRIVTYKVQDDIVWVQQDQDDQDASGFDDNVVDERAMDYGPANKPITRLPKQWGPDDPNHFSPMSDVTWRPEQWDQRYLRRWYSKENEMSKQAVDHLRGTRRTASNAILTIVVNNILERVRYELAASAKVGEIASPGEVIGAEVADYLARECQPETREKLAEALGMAAPMGTGFNPNGSKEERALTHTLSREVGRAYTDAQHREAAAADSHGTVDLTQWDPEGHDQKPEALEALALQFRTELDDLTIQWHPQYGRGNNVSPAEFMLVWGPDNGLDLDQQDELWRFMVATKMWDVREHQAWRRLRSSSEILRSDVPRAAKTASRRHAAVEVAVEDWFNDIDPWADWLARFDGFARAEDAVHKVAAQEGVVLARDAVRYAQKVVGATRDRVLAGSLTLDPQELGRLNQYLEEMHLDPIEGPDETIQQDIQDFKRVWGR